MGDPKSLSSKRMRLDKEEAHIVIVGGGLAGLSVAASLEQAGFRRISLFERDESFDVQKEGYGLTLTYNPKGPLAALGILEEVALQDCPSRSHYLFRPDGRILGYFGNAFSKSRGCGQRCNLRVPRKILRRILLKQLTITTIFWGHSIIDYIFQSETSTYKICFKRDGVEKIVEADLLVAADGIWSTVLSKIYKNLPCKKDVDSRMDSEAGQDTHETSPNNASFEPHSIGLRHMGIRLILGIADFSHPLLKERGFYTLNGTHRLFTMPYSSDRFDKSVPNRVMWQLSFAVDRLSTDISPLDPETLRDYASSTCQSWHEPVMDMIAATPTEKIWGTDLLDRDTRQVHSMVEGETIKRLVVVGDALHSMSPFKGQGANQALADGPLLARCLQRSSIDAAVKTFWRETVQRTAPVVEASRAAAKELHSPLVLTGHSVAGVRDEMVAEFLQVIREKNICASMGKDLDAEVLKVIEEFGVGDFDKVHIADPKQQLLALSHAARGDTPSLRRQSLDKHSESIRSARNAEGQSCLHLAAIGGHLGTVRWLLSEVGCDPMVVDFQNNYPHNYAMEADVISFMKAFFGERGIYSQ